MNLFRVGLLLSAACIAACSFEFSTANISEAWLARDDAGKDKTKTFGTKDTFYCVVHLANAPDDTRIKAVWIAVKCEGAPENYEIGSAVVTAGSGEVVHKMTLPKAWPVGSYKVELHLNDKLAKTLEFQVQS
jgi:hypothetical protein